MTSTQLSWVFVTLLDWAKSQNQNIVFSQQQQQKASACIIYLWRWTENAFKISPFQSITKRWGHQLLWHAPSRGAMFFCHVPRSIGQSVALSDLPSFSNFFEHFENTHCEDQVRNQSEYWMKLNEHIVMNFHHKQCVSSKIQWKGSSGQFQFSASQDSLYL